jgi:hypothetical protein
MERLFRPESFQIFSGNYNYFLVFSRGETARKLPKKIQKISGWILLSCSIDFRSFPAGFGDFTVSLRRNPLVSGGRNRRPGLISTNDVSSQQGQQVIKDRLASSQQLYLMIMIRLFQVHNMI